MLMRTAQAAALITPPSPVAPQIILEEAHARTNVKVGNMHLTVCFVEITQFNATLRVLSRDDVQWHAKIGDLATWDKNATLAVDAAGHIHRLHPSVRRQQTPCSKFGGLWVYCYTEAASFVQIPFTTASFQLSLPAGMPRDPE